MSKPMTFEEWSSEYGFRDLMYNREAFSAARQGMISEDGVVRIRPVENWPEHANGIAFSYTTYKNVKEQDSVDWGMIQYIPRPVPAWTPKVGDAVFAKLDYPIVAKVKSVDDGAIEITTPQGATWGTGLGNLKPFSPEHIGKPWEEIPNGN